jgi:hypothetical protein
MTKSAFAKRALTQFASASTGGMEAALARLAASKAVPTLAQLVTFCDSNAQHVVERGECNATQLAENCAHHFGHDEWLDDSEHAVWDAAQDAAEKYDSRFADAASNRRQARH